MDMFDSEPSLSGQGVTQLGNESNSSPIFANTYEFGFLILFNWDEGIQRPFEMFPRRTFSTSDIKAYCYEKNLNISMRIKKLKALRALPGRKMSLYAKVESSKYLTAKNRK